MFLDRSKKGKDELVRKYICGPGLDEPTAMIVVAEETETWYYYHFDGQGNIVALSNASQVIVEANTYDVFGRVTILNLTEKGQAWLADQVA